MFRFPSLNRVVRDSAEKIEAAQQLPAVADRVEQLLAVRDETAGKILKLEHRGMDIGMGSFLGIYVGLGLALAGAITCGFMGAVPVAAAVLLASPMFVAGAALTAISAVTCFVTGMGMDPLREDRDTIRRHIHRDVKAMVEAAPKEADKSNRYLHSLTCVFDAAAKDDRSYDKLLAKVGLKSKIAGAKAPNSSSSSANALTASSKAA